MRLTALVENTSCRQDIEYEHGLSLYIEACGQKILFDTGRGDMFLRNARRLGIDISKVDMAVLSHGHYDHGGGLAPFLSENKTAKIYMSRYAFEPHYADNTRYIGLDAALENNPRFVLTGDESEIAQGLTLHTYHALPCEPFAGAKGLEVMENGQLVQDDFRHEQYLLIHENDKTVLVSGCSHKGIVNILRFCESDRPDAVIGGFHMMHIAPESDEGRQEIASAAARLMQTNAHFYTCHCTGKAQYELLKTLMQERISYLSCGMTIEI